MSTTSTPTATQWLAGARPRTLPAAISPVLAGSAAAANIGLFSWPLALLCLVVSLSLQVGVNYANDYSDGVRGTDTDRVGPMRLVGSGAAEPRLVKLAAFAMFAVAGLAGLVMVLMTGQWWLLIVGALCILAAWFYTGGKNPYGYLGLGEVFVFVFFGLVAVCGTCYIQAARVTPAALLAAVTIGALACALLVANNLRDIDGDLAAGKRTLAARIGTAATRKLYAGLVTGAALAVIGIAIISSWWALLGLVFVPIIAQGVRIVLGGGASGPELIRVLASTGTAELLCAAGLAAGLILGR